MHSYTCIFRGVCTALITPMADGKIDYVTLRELIDWQISQKVDALLVCGTTGEASTLSAKERKELVMRAGEMIDGRVPYIVGCGTNATGQTLAWGCHAAACGADALLVVTPYYNKGTEEGLYRHFALLSEKIPLPQILYHVPGRTGVRLSVAQVRRLADLPHLVALKEADPDIDRLLDIKAACGDDLALYCGNDSLTIPTLSVGGIGTISVISNILPYEMGELIRLYLSGRGEQSLALQMRLLPLMRLLFAATNPAPVKYAMAECGFGTGELRLPLYEIPEELAERIRKALSLL